MCMNRCDNHLHVWNDCSCRANAAADTTSFRLISAYCTWIFLLPLWRMTQYSSLWIHKNVTEYPASVQALTTNRLFIHCSCRLLTLTCTHLTIASVCSNSHHCLAALIDFVIENHCAGINFNLFIYTVVLSCYKRKALIPAGLGFIEI